MRGSLVVRLILSRSSLPPKLIQQMLTTKRWNEENTVEHPIIEWLVTPEMGWHFENQAAVNERYRSDEVEVLLLPILRQKLRI
jgi:hypothetical protein